MTEEKIEEIKHILFHEYSWTSTEIDKLDLHINDVIEATEQAINYSQCCESDSELLKTFNCINFVDGFEKCKEQCVRCKTAKGF